MSSLFAVSPVIKTRLNWFITGLSYSQHYDTGTHQEVYVIEVFEISYKWKGELPSRTRAALYGSNLKHRAGSN